MTGISCGQDSQALSSAEAEWHVGARGLSEALGIKSLLSFTGYTVAIRWRCDSSAARALARRLDTGRIKHLATRTLWIQTLQKAKLIEIIAVPGE